MRRSSSISFALLPAMLHYGVSFALAFQVSTQLARTRFSNVQEHAASRRRWARVMSSSSSALGVIQADAVDFDFDVGQGGVRLAQETSVLLSGTVQHAPGSAVAGLDDLRRYDQLQQVPEASVKLALQTVSAKVVGSGRGRELYKDPGSTTVSDVTHAPKDAARDALVGAGTAMDCDRIQINYLGGQDLQYLEVLEAVQQLVLNLDVKTKCQVSYNSLSNGQFPTQAATVTVVGWTGDAITEGSSALAELSELERSVALGRLFFCDGTYYTYLDADLNPAVA